MIIHLRGLFTEVGFLAAGFLLTARITLRKSSLLFPYTPIPIPNAPAAITQRLGAIAAKRLMNSGIMEVGALIYFERV
jgi:hypothetical protein